MVFGRWRRRDEGLPGGRGIPPAPEEPSTGRRRRPRPVRPEAPELVEIEVGFDRFAAGALVARLEAEEVPVRLLTMDEHGMMPGRANVHPHRILIRAADEHRVRDLIHRTM